MRPIRTVRAVKTAPFESLGTLLSSHRAITRVSLAALSFTIIAAFSHQAAPTQAGPESAPLVPESILPQNVGIAVATDNEITIPFDAAMEPDSVEGALQILPHQKVEATWNEDHTRLTISPEHLWRADERYLIFVGASAQREDGETLAGVKRYAFTTQTAPIVSDFQVSLVGLDDAAAATGDEAVTGTLSVDPVRGSPTPGSQPPTRTAKDVSATSSISVSFSARMDESDVEDHFVITPEADGELSWSDGKLVFSPSGRLEPGARYTISVIGSHDAAGNLLGGKGNFSFIVQPGAQLTRTEPGLGAKDVEPATVVMWFSQPMDVDATNAAFTVTDTATGSPVAGRLDWNEAGTQLTYTPDEAFAAGRKFEVAVGDGGRDVDGNTATASWWFMTTAAAPEPAAAAAPARSETSSRSTAPTVPPPAPATSLAGHALNQVNAARAAYGFAPVVLDASISAVASAHAMDQAVNGYFSHTGRNGSTRESRLRAGGVSFSWSGENQCYRVGMSERGTLDWCHAQFMSEPYPGHFNHIANILNPNARRMGVGIATVNGRTVITWNFTN